MLYLYSITRIISISGPLVTLLRFPLIVVMTLATVVASDVTLSNGERVVALILGGIGGGLGTSFCTVPTCWKHACTIFSGKRFLHKRRDRGINGRGEIDGGLKDILLKYG